MMSTISQESIEKTTAIFLRGRLGVHEALLVAGGYETTLHQTARHRRQAQHRQIILLGTHILTTCSLTDILLHVLSQFHTILHVLVLDELEHDVTLRRIRVITLIGLLVILLQKDNSILTLSDL